MSEPDELAKADQKVDELKKRIARQLEVVDRVRESGLSAAANEAVVQPSRSLLQKPPVAPQRPRAFLRRPRIGSLEATARVLGRYDSFAPRTRGSAGMRCGIAGYVTAST